MALVLRVQKQVSSRIYALATFLYCCEYGNHVVAISSSSNVYIIDRRKDDKFNNIDNFPHSRISYGYHTSYDSESAE